MKTCPKCKTSKERSAFYSASTRKDGLRPYCKECGNAQARKWSKDNYSYVKKKLAWNGVDKLCGCCKAIKPLTMFYKSNDHSANGYRSYCKPCNNSKARDWQKKNLPKLALRQKEFYSKNKEIYRDANKRWRQNNPEYNKQRFVDWLHKTGRNPERCAKRRADRIKRTPSWADIEKIKDVYSKCPNGFHVDHIIPMNGKNVCGLHIEYNLQYLTRKENLTKSNKFSEGY